MKGARFEVSQDAAGEWRWHLQSANGRILADSGEGYSRKHDAERAIRTVIRAVGWHNWTDIKKAFSDPSKTFRFRDFQARQH